MRKSIIAILMTFCLSIMTYAQTPRDRATELKEQAQSSLNQKDYIKARYLFKKAYEAFATRENYPQAIECGVQANALYVRENFYKEGFELCRDMDQLIWAGEQNQKKVFYDLRFLVNKERLQMYTALKNPAQAKTQLNKLIIRCCWHRACCKPAARASRCRLSRWWRCQCTPKASTAVRWAWWASSSASRRPSGPPYPASSSTSGAGARCSSSWARCRRWLWCCRSSCCPTW